jgi:pre-mycofactocin synthase
VDAHRPVHRVAGQFGFRDQADANGQAGVENMLDVLRGGIDSALRGLGKSSVHDLRPDDLVIPSGFERRLGLIAPGS